MSMRPSHAMLFGGPPNNPTSNEIGWMGSLIVIVGMTLVHDWENWEKRHQRPARLDAYRCRDQWRKADISRLLKLGVPRHRIERFIGDDKRRGRGVVRDYLSLDEMLIQTAEQFSTLLSPDTPEFQRLNVLKQTPLWRYVVEALYRGEHGAARETRQKSPSMHAETRVAGCLVISQAQVRKICVRVRKERQCENKPFESESVLSIQQFKVWINTLPPA